jgi:hypothetical protein
LTWRQFTNWWLGRFAFILLFESMTERQFNRVRHEFLFWVWLSGAGYILYTVYDSHKLPLLALFLFAIEIYMASYHKNECEKFLTNKNKHGKEVAPEEDR